MTTFGDVRAACHSGSSLDLREALEGYDDDDTPTLDTLRYVGAERLADVAKWAGSSNPCADFALDAVGDYENAPLTLTLGVLKHRWPNPQMSIHRALQPFRWAQFCERWRPWAREHGVWLVTKRLEYTLIAHQMWIDGDLPVEIRNLRAKEAWDEASHFESIIPEPDVWNAVRAITFVRLWNVAKIADGLTLKRQVDVAMIAEALNVEVTR